MVFLWIFRNKKYPKFSWTIHRILADLNNAVIWMVSICPLIFRSFSLFTNLIIIIMMMLFHVSSSHQRKLRGFGLSVSDSKSHQIFWTLLKSLVNLISAMVWMVSILHLIYSFSSIFWKLSSVHQLQLILPSPTCSTFCYYYYYYYYHYYYYYYYYYY